MKYLKQIAYVLVLVGGLNWGVYGISRYNLIDIIFESIPMVAGVLYVLVGLSAVYIILNKYVLSSCSCTNSCCSSSDNSATYVCNPSDEIKTNIL